jgi:hypothetical protein
VILDSLNVDPHAFEARTGWAIKPEGACKGDVCVPLPSNVRNNSGQLDVNVLSERLGMPLVSHENRIYALGPESGITGRALTTAQAPDITLPDLDGHMINIGALKPMKVVLVAWASW